MTNEQRPHEPNETATDFAREAKAGHSSLLREQLDLLRHNKKWWMLPILLSLLVIGVLVVLSGTAVAPLIYTLF